MHLTRVFATSAVLAASIVGFGAAPAANAEPLCEQVFMSGWALFSPTGAGDCVPSISAGFCDYEHEAVVPVAYVNTVICLPEPVSAP